MPTAGVTHDLTIEDVGGTNRTGFMLARNRNGQRSLAPGENRVIAPRSLTMGELTRSEFPAEVQMLQFQEDWVSGIGGQIHRLHPKALGEASYIQNSTQGVLRPAPDTLTPSLDQTPETNTSGAAYRDVPSAFAVSGDVWAFIGAQPYKWDYTNKQWDRVSMPLNPGTGGRIYRNGVTYGANEVVAAWSDDLGSGDYYAIADAPARYMVRATNLAQGDATAWTVIDGADQVNDPDAFKYFAVANSTFFGAHTVTAADSGLNTDMVPTFDAASSGTDQATTALTLSHTCGTAGNRGLIVGVSWEHSAGRTVSTVTYNSVSMTGLTRSDNGYARCQLFYLAAPATGANNVVVTMSASVDEIVVGAMSFFDVHQTTVVGTVANANATSTNASVAVGTVAADMAVAVIANASSGTGSPGSGTTERWDANTGHATGIGGHETATGTSTTINWTVTSGAWAMSGVALKPALRADTSGTIIPISGTPSSQFVAGDVIRIDSELMLVVSVSDTPAQLTVIRAYRGTLAAAHSTDATNIYEMTRNVHYFNSTTDPSTLATWGGATTVGDASSEITGMVGVGGDLIIAKTDGIYLYTASAGSPAVSELRPELRARRHPDNGRGMWTFNTKVFYPLGDGGLLELETSNYTIRDVSLNLTMPDLDGRTKFASATSPSLHGRVVAGYAEPQAMYVLVLESGQTKYHLLSAVNIGTGSTAQTGQDPDYRWSNLGAKSYATGTDANHATVYCEAVPSSTKTHRRVHFGIESTGSDLTPSFIPLSAIDDEFVYEHTNIAKAVTTEFDFNLPNVNKTYETLEVHTRNCNAAGRSVTTEVSIDGAAFAATGLAAISSTSALDQRTELTFTAGTTGYRMTIRFTFAQSAATAIPPEIIDFTLRGKLRAESLRLIPLRIVLEDQQRLLNGSIQTRTKSALQQLYTWKNQAAEVRVRLPSEIHATADSGYFDAVFLADMFRVQEVTNEVNRRASYVVTAGLAEAK